MEIRTNFWCILKVEPTEFAGGWWRWGARKTEKDEFKTWNWWNGDTTDRNGKSAGGAGSWLAGDGSVEQDFDFEYFIVEMPTEHPSKNTSCAMAYMNPAFSGTWGLAIDISMSIILRQKVGGNHPRGGSKWEREEAQRSSPQVLQGWQANSEDNTEPITRSHFTPNKLVINFSKRKITSENMEKSRPFVLVGM